MCGGTDSAFGRAEPILQAMGKNIFHAGSAGAGQAAKVCNNLMLAIQMISVSEGFALADKLDLDRQKLFDIASTATSQCWSMTSYCPGSGPGPDVSGEPRLCGRVHRGNDAQGSDARSRGRGRGCCETRHWARRRRICSTRLRRPDMRTWISRQSSKRSQRSDLEPCEPTGQPSGVLRLRQLLHKRLCQPSLSNLFPHIMQGRSLGASPSARARPICSKSPSIVSAGTALVCCIS